MKKESIVTAAVASLVILAVTHLGCWLYNPVTCVKLVTISKSLTGELTVTGDTDVKVSGLVMSMSVPLIQPGGALIIHQSQNDKGDDFTTWFSDK